MGDRCRPRAYLLHVVNAVANTFIPGPVTQVAIFDDSGALFIIHIVRALRGFRGRRDRLFRLRRAGIIAVAQVIGHVFQLLFLLLALLFLRRCRARREIDLLGIGTFPCCIR